MTDGPTRRDAPEGKALQPRHWWRRSVSAHRQGGRLPSSPALSHAGLHLPLAATVGRCSWCHLSWQWEKKRGKERIIAGNKSPLLGVGNLTILGALVPISVALRLARAIVGQEVRLMGSLTASGGRALCRLCRLLKLRTTWRAPPAGEHEPPPAFKAFPLPGHKSRLSQWKLERDPSWAEAQQLRPSNNSPTHRKLAHSSDFEFQGALVSDCWFFFFLPSPAPFGFSFSSMLFVSLNRASFIIIIPNSGLLY